MTTQTPTLFELDTTYIHLPDGPRALPLEVGPDFWATIATRTDLDDGRLVALFHYDGDWPTSEVHPAGDEIVYLLSGRVDLVLEEDAGERVVEMRGGTAAIVPRGVWHTARVHEPGDALHITCGAGTQNRPAPT
jgi:mannose-6-phosphate isomerase-like protein (cupin superfamily)